MRTNEYPRELRNVSTNVSLPLLKHWLKNYCVIADVDVTINEPVYPIRVDKYTCYPVGSFRTVLSTPELLYAIDRGWIKTVYVAAVYRKAHLFRSFVDYYRSKRVEYDQQQNKVMSRICKMMINSLYGKFGQRQITQQIVGHCEPHIVKRESVIDAKTFETYELIYIGGTIFREIKAGETRFSCPSIAAHVTAYARMYLWNYIRKVVHGQVYYCDTDSLIIDSSGLVDLLDYIDDHEIGKLKVECVGNHLSIQSRKSYVLGDRVRLKGISRSAQHIGNNRYIQDYWLRLKGLVQFGDLDNYTVRHIEKSLSNQIHGGILTPSGWIQPFVFG